MELNPFLGYLSTEVGTSLLSVSRTHTKLHNSLNGLQLRIRFILQAKLSLIVLFLSPFLYKLKTSSFDFAAKSSLKCNQAQVVSPVPSWRLLYTIYSSLTEQSSVNRMDHQQERLKLFVALGYFYDCGKLISPYSLESEHIHIASCIHLS